jgi:hypothetical protein
VVINNHAISNHNTTYIYDGSWARVIRHSSEDRLLHYMDTRRMDARQFVEISYSPIGLSIADITVV